MAWQGYLRKYNFPPEVLKEWWRVRQKFRSTHHYCKLCGKTFLTGELKIVDHRTPHKGDIKLFLAVGNLQVLCKRCHDSRKQLMERHAEKPAVGIDGWQV